MVLPRPGHPLTRSGYIRLHSRETDFCLFTNSQADINESLRMANFTLFFFSGVALLILEYNEKRMQSNGTIIYRSGRYRGHYLRNLKVDPAYTGLDSLQTSYTQNPQAGAFCSHSASISLCTSGHHATKGTATRSRPFSGQRG